MANDPTPSPADQDRGADGGSTSDQMRHADAVNGENTDDGVHESDASGSHRTGVQQAHENRENEPPA